MTSSNSYITRAEFNKHVHMIYNRSIEIQDFSWRLIKIVEQINSETLQVNRTSVQIESKSAIIEETDLLYLEKTSQAFIKIDSKYF